MYRASLVLLSLVVGCSGGSTQVGTSSTPPTGGGADGGVGTPNPGGGPPTPGGGGTGGPSDGGMGGGGGGGGSGGTSGGGGSGGGGGTGSACQLDGPVAVSTQQFSGFEGHIVGDDANLYFLAEATPGESQVLYSIPKAGGSATLTHVGGGPVDPAVDATTIYVGRSGDLGDPSSGGGVTLIDKATGAQRFVAATSATCRTPAVLGLAVFAGNVYFGQTNVAAGFSCVNPPEEPMRINVVPPGASAPQALATTNETPTAVLADASHVFWSDRHAIWRLPRSGGTPEKLADGSPSSFRIASDGNTLFVLDTAGVHAIVAPGVTKDVWSGVASGLFDDGRHLYIASTGGVVRLDNDGNGATTLVSEADVAGVFADDTYVYFYGANRTIEKACK